MRDLDDEEGRESHARHRGVPDEDGDPRDPRPERRDAPRAGLVQCEPREPHRQRDPAEHAEADIQRGEIDELIVAEIEEPDDVPGGEDIQRAADQPPLGEVEGIAVQMGERRHHAPRLAGVVPGEIRARDRQQGGNGNVGPAACDDRPDTREQQQCGDVDRRPGIPENYFDVEKHKQQRHQVKFHR